MEKVTLLSASKQQTGESADILQYHLSPSGAMIFKPTFLLNDSFSYELTNGLIH